jgi:hypothetical protein
MAGSDGSIEMRPCRSNIQDAGQGSEPDTHRLPSAKKLSENSGVGRSYV